MKKFSNKVLIGILVLLMGIFALSKIFRAPQLESNLRKELVAVDTSIVSEVRIQPAKENGEIKLIKNGNKWKVVADNREADAEGGTVESMLGVLINLQAQRMVTRREEKWDTFEVGESGTRVSIYTDSKKLADFRVGKTGFVQSQNPGQGISGAYTYIRLTDEDEVYSSDGFIGSHFNRGFNDWRNKAFLRITKDDVNKIEFNYPDSGYVLQKRDSVWFVDEELANESKVTQYFSKIRFKNLSNFEDGFIQPGTATLVIHLSGSAGIIATARAWPKTDQDWVVSSTLQEGVFFSGKTSDVIKDVFPGREWFLKL